MPPYFQVNTDINGNIGYTTPDLNNPNDPNINVYYDTIEFATVNAGINANTTQVDEFGFPQLLSLSGNGLTTQTVGTSTSRSQIFTDYQQQVPAAFQQMLTAQAPIGSSHPSTVSTRKATIPPTLTATSIRSGPTIRPTPGPSRTSTAPSRARSTPAPMF